MIVIFIPKYIAIWTGPDAEDAWTERRNLPRKSGMIRNSHLQWSETASNLEKSINLSYSGGSNQPPKKSKKKKKSSSIEKTPERIPTIQLATIKALSSEIMDEVNKQNEEKPA